MVERTALLAALRALGAGADDDIPLSAGALLLAALDQPGIGLERYHSHLQKLARDVRAAHDRATEDTALTRLDSLRAVIAIAEAYRGDVENYDDLQNASLIRTIDRRRGLPITLAILYLHVARTLGWAAHGLNFPGHFLVRMDHAGARLIFDPFREGKVLQAADLRQILKETVGPSAELSADYYTPAGNRAILIRLQNNIKTRQITAEDYDGAWRTIAAMRLLDPSESRLLLEAGVLGLRTDRLAEAEKALEAYLPLSPDADSRREAAILLQQIRRQRRSAPE